MDEMRGVLSRMHCRSAALEGRRAPDAVARARAARWHAGGRAVAVGERAAQKAARAAYERRRHDVEGRYQFCFRGLSLGDHHAPDIAQESHVNAVRGAGCMRDDEALEYRRKVPENESRPARAEARGERGVDRGQVARLRGGRREREEVPEVELEVNERKKVRRATVFDAWGGQVEGDTGWNGPPRQVGYLPVWPKPE